MINEIISAAALVLVAIIEAIAAHDRKKVKEEAAKTASRAAIRAEESRLSMRMQDAAIELGVATAIAVADHKLNGEMHAARSKAEEAQAAYSAFMQKITSGQVTKV